MEGTRDHLTPLYALTRNKALARWVVNRHSNDRFLVGIFQGWTSAFGRFETDVSAITAPLALAGPSLASLEPLFERLA